MKIKLTPAFVQNAPPPKRGDREVYWDESLPCFGLVVTRSGHRSFVVQYRANGKSRRMTFKADSQGGLTLDKARREARAVIGAVTKGADPIAERRKSNRAGQNTLRAVAEEYIKRDGRKLRSIADRRAALERLVFPVLGTWQIEDIRRSDVTRLLDKIEDERGPVMADHILAYLRKIMNWHAKRSDDFESPIVRGMARTKPKERRRQRTLDDAELRAIWRAVEEHPSAFGRLVQFLLLTATRRNEAARMKREEVSGKDWTIPPARYKTGLELLVPLSPLALAVLPRTPDIGGKFVFTTDGKRPLSGFSKFKSALDKACGVSGWSLHDCRRTARSLMSRAGVSSDHAELCLGHVLPGVRGTYDRHSYADEKRAAFEVLAGLINRIVAAQANVTPSRNKRS